MRIKWYPWSGIRLDQNWIFMHRGEKGGGSNFRLSADVINEWTLTNSFLLLNIIFVVFLWFNSKTFTHTAFLTHANYAAHAKISTHGTHAKILWTHATHATLVTHAKILWTHATHTTYAKIWPTPLMHPRYPAHPGTQATHAI